MSTPFTTGPDPNRGWSILREFSDRLPHELGNCFESYARIFEGMFTSGIIANEVIYRSFPTDLLPAKGETPDAYVTRMDKSPPPYRGRIRKIR
jgi:hypothetical protein